MSNLDRNGFQELSEGIQNKILDFDLWVIEIDERNNPDFEPVDLYLRLNSKPFAIKENTFEMWNSYIDSNIIKGIKELSNAHKDWFYLRKNNARMDNEDLITSLIYLSFKSKTVKKDFNSINSFLDFYLSNERISVRIKAKNDISSILEREDNRLELLKEITEFKGNFLDILAKILGGKKNNLSDSLDKLLNADTKRTSKNFYIVWLLLFNIDKQKLEKGSTEIRRKISSIIKMTNKIKSREVFEKTINEFLTKYNR